MTVQRTFPGGAWEVSDIIRGHLVTRVYIGYTKREAMRLFREEAGEQ